uniref:Protein TsetseEP domain-containing protein n=1 Tax=Anopheles albimanus TaxID=7167 RepID=A0A182G011_ANOAL
MSARDLLVLLGVLASVLLSFAPSQTEAYLVDYQAELSNLSSLVIRDVAASWKTNNELNGELNRFILEKLANATVQARRADDLVANLLETAENSLSEGCNEQLDQLRREYRTAWGVDLQECARNTHFALEYDALTRFRPQASSVLRIFPSANYQTVRVIAMSDVFDSGSINQKLSDELRSYQELWSSYQPSLQQELDRYQDSVDDIGNGLDTCLTMIEEYRTNDLLLIETLIDLNCETMV